jgi:general secretion pathway protein H
MISISDGFVKISSSSLPGSFRYGGVPASTPHASGFGRRFRVAADRRGFTLLELIVVMVLMALGVSLITTSLGRGIGRRRPKAFVQQFVSLCRQARTEALSTARPVSLTIDGDVRRCWLDARKPGLKIPEIMKIEVEDRVSSYRAETGYQVVFFPDGSTTGDRLVFSVDGRPMAFLHLDPLTGLIRLQSTREQS